MAADCAMCGRSRDAHNRHVRFRLPDPVLSRAEQEPAPGTWMSHADPMSSVMMDIPDVGPFVRALLPVALEGGGTVTFGLWLGIHPADLARAISSWWAPSYPELVLDGRLANDVQPWGLLGRPAKAAVRDPEHTPYVTSSSDPLTQLVLSRPWPHAEVLDALPDWAH